MIVKNEQENLPRCLASVEGIFDEIIVVDTGSTDRTKEVPRKFGARVFDFDWVDRFAAARNESLSHATGDYAFWLDADDEVEPADRFELLTLLAGLKRPSAGGVASAMLPVTPPLTRPAGVLSPGRGENQRVSHGTVSSTIEVARPPTRPAGDLSPGRGVHQRVSHGTVSSTGELAEALAYLKRSLAGSAPTDSIVCKLFPLIARTHQTRGDSQATLATCAMGLELMPEDAELRFRKGSCINIVVSIFCPSAADAGALGAKRRVWCATDHFGRWRRMTQHVFLQRINNGPVRVAIVT